MTMQHRSCMKINKSHISSYRCQDAMNYRSMIGRIIKKITDDGCVYELLDFDLFGDFCLCKEDLCNLDLIQMVTPPPSTGCK